ncbi:MAG: D-alanyl-D-alanine carboxypeptidase [Treponemataceae bacterium]|nr:D-alanyl-D-alanine carboxypeptidase [Treponemataceae bacterium]
MDRKMSENEKKTRKTQQTPDNPPKESKKIKKAKKELSSEEILAKKIRRKIAVLVTALLLLVLVSFTIAAYSVYSHRLTHPQVTPLSDEAQAKLNSYLTEKYSFGNLNPLPYKAESPELDLYAKAAIICDVSNGCVLYEKNADLIIPPASLTKLAVMYVAETDMAAGRASEDDLVRLPQDCWAINMPPDSSLMFLAEGQKVTLRELMLGLAVPSGNDAAYAIAFYLSGGIEPYIRRMNAEMQKLGLQNTKFVEPSGYSDENRTTAREFLAFCRVYLRDYPESLEKYHSVKEFAYPQKENLPDWIKLGSPQTNPFILTSPLLRKNTNKALWSVEGADGLKTGYIDESGYNLALTVKREDTRFISVTLGGPGSNSTEGSAYRTQDGQTLMDWAFSAYVSAQMPQIDPVTLIAAGGTSYELQAIPAFNRTITVPLSETLTRNEENKVILDTSVRIPQYVEAPVSVGDILGWIDYSADGQILESVPLVADRDIHPANQLKLKLDNWILTQKKD